MVVGITTITAVILILYIFHRNIILLLLNNTIIEFMSYKACTTGNVHIIDLLCRCI